MSAPVGSSQKAGAKPITSWYVGAKPVIAAYVGPTQVA